MAFEQRRKKERVHEFGFKWAWYSIGRFLGNDDFNWLEAAFIKRDVV